MLTKAGLAVIGALSTGREATAADLAMETEYSQTHLYDVLDELLESGCSPNTVGQTTSGRVSLTDHPVVEAYRALRSNSDVEWPDLLSPATLGYAGISTNPDVCLDCRATQDYSARRPQRRCHRSSIARCYPLRPRYALVRTSRRF